MSPGFLLYPTVRLPTFAKASASAEATADKTPGKKRDTTYDGLRALMRGSHRRFLGDLPV
jgi:hypothetical protein